MPAQQSSGAHDEERTDEYTDRRQKSGIAIFPASEEEHCQNPEAHQVAAEEELEVAGHGSPVAIVSRHSQCDCTSG